MQMNMYIILFICLFQLNFTSRGLLYPNTEETVLRRYRGLLFSRPPKRVSYPNRVLAQSNENSKLATDKNECQCGEEGVLEKRPLAGNEDSIPDDVQKRVVGGAEVKPRNRYPWMALIKDNEEQLCGGAIINDRFVLTAAHCIDACEESSGCKVVLGVHNIRESKGAYDIDSFIKHDEYSLFENDIGLIKLKRRIRFNESMKPICLPKQQSLSEIVPYSENITSAGWGLTSKGRGSDVLMEFVGEDWLKGDRSKSKFCKNLLCLRQVNGRFESGDSGGPAWIKIGKKDHVVGVISHYRLHRMRLTRVALVVDWIIDKTRGAYYCY